MKIITKQKPKRKLSAFFDRFTEKEATEPYQKLVSSFFELGQIPKNSNELANFKAAKLHTVLNRFIADGITFDVSETDFQIIDNAQILRTSDKEFLQINNAAILCQLQQSLLMKHLFNHSPEHLEDFAFEVWERVAIMSGGGKESNEIYFSAVKSTTRIWFNDLLNEEKKIK